MSSSIAAITTGTGGVITTADNSGNLNLVSGTTTIVAVTSTGASVTGDLSATGITTVAAGTAALPAVVSATGTADTGLWFPAADTVAASTGGTERLRIDSSGNVGIGTTAPSKKLEVYASANSLQIESIVRNDQAGTGVAAIGFNVSSVASSETTSTKAGIGLQRGFVFGGGALCFYNNNSGAAGDFTTADERMRIDSSGRVLVNATAIIGSDTAPLQVTGGSVTAIAVKGGSNNYFQAFYNTSSSLIGSITGSSGSSTAYNTSSDYRLKNTIAPMTGALDKVALLKPVTYKWNVDGADGQGFIAHELAEVVPDCVTGEKDAVETYTDEDGNEATRPVHQGIDTSFLVATLTAAIQELKAIIDTQAAQIAALNAKVGI